MDISTQLAQAEAERAALLAQLGKEKPAPKAKAGKIIPPSYPWLAQSSSFQAFCRPRINGKTETMDQILAKRTKARQAELRAAMKPKGVYSILKGGPYWTGRLVTTNGACGVPEELKIRKVNGEWVSEDPWEGETVAQNVPDFGKDAKEPAQAADEALLAAMEEQNRLLRELLERRAA